MTRGQSGQRFPLFLGVCLSDDLPVAMVLPKCRAREPPPSIGSYHRRRRLHPFRIGLPFFPDRRLQSMIVTTPLLPSQICLTPTGLVAEAKPLGAPLLPVSDSGVPKSTDPALIEEDESENEEDDSEDEGFGDEPGDDTNPGFDDGLDDDDDLDEFDDIDEEDFDDDFDDDFEEELEDDYEIEIEDEISAEFGLNSASDDDEDEEIDDELNDFEDFESVE